MKSFDELVRLLKRLPGMGEKSASRLAFHLMKTDKAYNQALSNAIGTIQERVNICPICGSYSEGECEYCNNEKRDKSLICIVEEPEDVFSIASSGAYNGLFHVLGGAIDPLNGIGPGSLRIRELLKRIDEGAFQEAIIATNPTEEGDTTALYLSELLSKREGLSVSRLASGLPIGGELGYVDKLTLQRSLKGRIKFSK